MRQHNLIPFGETVVIGVSGGADSICLLTLLHECQNELGMRLHVAHLNHGLRGAESDADASYVAALARSLFLPITFDRQDVASYKARKKCSLEEGARELRYAFFTRVAEEVGSIRVAVGHTQDDQVETVLMHILRGTGTSGLRGLAPCSSMLYGKQEMSLRAARSNLLVIRPLLDITREEAMRYCQEHKLEPRFDSSNRSLSFFRNRLRLELLPLLRQYNPCVDQALLRLADIAKGDDSFIEKQALHLWDEVARREDNAVCLDKKKISTLPIALQRQVVRLAIDELVGDTRDIEAVHIEALRTLLSKPVGKQISLPNGIICHGEYDEIIIRVSRSPDFEHSEEGGMAKRYLPLSCPFPILQGDFPLKVPGKTILPGWRVVASISPSGIATLTKTEGKQSRNPHRIRGGAGRVSFLSTVAEFDLNKTGTNLSLRQRQPGDRFQPLGMNTAKKLSEFMIDAKIPFSWRHHVPLVCSPEQIIWVVGYRIDDRAKVTEATREILRLEFSYS